MENGILLNPGTIKAGAKLQRRHPPSFLYPAECVEKGRATTPASFFLYSKISNSFSIYCSCSFLYCCKSSGGA